MLPEDTFNDKETQVLKVALKNLADQLTRTLALTHIKLNEFDLMEPRHTLMHTLTALEKITRTPIKHFMNPLQPTTPPKDVATLQQPPDER
jgi:hypothetical protein